MHLGMEKLLKAHVVKSSRQHPPRIHDLLRLSELSGLVFTDKHRKFMASFQQYNLSGRYPDNTATMLPRAEAMTEMEQAQEVAQWLINQLN